MAEDARQIDSVEDAEALAAAEAIFQERFSQGADHDGQGSVGCWQTSTATTFLGEYQSS